MAIQNNMFNLFLVLQIMHTLTTKVLFKQAIEQSLDDSIVKQFKVGKTMFGKDKSSKCSKYENSFSNA